MAARRFGFGRGIRMIVAVSPLAPAWGTVAGIVNKRKGPSRGVRSRPGPHREKEPRRTLYMNKASAPVSFREDTPAAEGWDGVPNLTYPGHVVGDGKISFNRAAAGAPD